MARLKSCPFKAHLCNQFQGAIQWSAFLLGNRTHSAVQWLTQALPVAQLTLEIRIEHAQSLKDRRQVVRSLKDQLRQGFNVSVAEMDEAVTWQSATIGVVAISRSRDYLHGLIEEVERAARRILNEHGAELYDAFWEYVES